MTVIHTSDDVDEEVSVSLINQQYTKPTPPTHEFIRHPDYRAMGWLRQIEGGRP